MECDLKARALERLVARLILSFNNLLKLRQQEQYEQHCRLIDAVYERKVAEAKTTADALRLAGAAAYDAISHLAKIGIGDLSGDVLLKNYPRGGFDAEIRSMLGVRLSSLFRGASNVKRHAGNVNYFPSGNMSDSLCFSELRSEIPDLHLDTWNLEEAEPEPVAAAAGRTN